MNLSQNYFSKDYHYRIKFVNKCITIIRFSKSEKRVKSFKNLVFRMMKDVVLKNISNYINLLRGTALKNDLPDKDELIADCYIMFDKCVTKFIINKKNNFYFYYNKSLSRSFFRSYQKELQKSKNVKVTEALIVVNSKFHDNRGIDTTNILVDSLCLSELEKKVCLSRLSGQKTAEFLKENENISSGKYSKCLKNIKKILIKFQEEGEI